MQFFKFPSFFQGDFGNTPRQLAIFLVSLRINPRPDHFWQLFDDRGLPCGRKLAQPLPHNVAIDAEGIMTRFEEKPQNPQGTLAAIALYYYSPSVLSLLKTYLDAGNNADQPGRFVEWLYTRKPVNTFENKGQWLDIGSKETLENADKILRAPH